MRRVFDPENLVWSILSWGVDLVGLGLFWALLSLPVVTVGAASCALYFTVVKCFTHREPGAFGVMLRAFRDNLRRGVPAGLVCLAAGAALYFGYGVMQTNWGSDLGAVLFVAYDLLLLVPMGIACWLFPLLGRFDMGVGDAFRTAGALALRHLPRTLLVAVTALLLTVFTINYWWPVFFTPVTVALVSARMFERVFAKYLSADEAAKLSGRTPGDGPSGEE